MSHQPSDNERTNALNTTLTSMTKNWHALRSVGQTWNLKSAAQAMEKLAPLTEGLWSQWQETQAELISQMDAIRIEISSPAYAEALERELKAAGVPVTGAFPQYMMPPFKLSVSIDNLEVRLSMGRKNERTTELEPEILAQWVATRYKKVISRRFNANAFLKDLLEAYRIANRLNYREATLTYGRAVPLMELYDILTLRAGVRQEYPSQFFIYDLSLLKESGITKTDRFSFEFGTARDQKKAIVVVDNRGREDRISSLTVHELEGGR